MSKTHRCIECPVTVEHWTDEICGACGRCPSHCMEFVSTFSSDAKTRDEKPHPLAAKTLTFRFVPVPTDQDRPQEERNAVVPILAGSDSESIGLQPVDFVAVQQGALAGSRRDFDNARNDDGGEADGVRGIGQRSAAKPRPGRRNSRGDT